MPRTTSSRRLAIALLGLSLGLSGCGRAEFKRESYVFGTRVEITVVDASEVKAAPIVDEALQDLDRLHGELHAWQPSPVMNMNRAFAQGREYVVGEETADLIRWSRWAYERSDGLFNPAIGGLIAAWGFHSDRFPAALPAPQLIDAWVRADPTPNDVRLNDRQAYSVNPAVRLDFGGLAKGWALDRVARHLQSHGIRHALINIGGNILALGRNGDRPWHIGLQHPRKPEAMLEVALRHGEAIGTSGDYQRYFMVNGKRYHHLIDPRSGRPATQSISATVIARPGAKAGLISDVASKPLFIQGASRGESTMRRFGVQDWLVVHPDGTVYLSKTMQTRVHWQGAPPKAVVVEPRAG